VATEVPNPNQNTFGESFAMPCLANHPTIQPQAARRVHVATRHGNEIPAASTPSPHRLFDLLNAGMDSCVPTETTTVGVGGGVDVQYLIDRSRRRRTRRRTVQSGTARHGGSTGSEWKEAMERSYFTMSRACHPARISVDCRFLVLYPTASSRCRRRWMPGQFVRDRVGFPCLILHSNIEMTDHTC
jgi:hypothetical protein